MSKLSLLAICSLLFTTVASTAQTFQPGKPPGGTSGFGFTKIRTVGAEIITDGSFASGATNWITAGAVSIASGKATYAAGATTNRVQQTITTSAIPYRVTFVIADFVSAAPAMTVNLGGTIVTVPVTGPGTYVKDITSAAGPTMRIQDAAGVGSFSITAISVKSVL